MEFQFDVDACLTNEITLVTASDVSSHHNQSDTEKKIKEQRSRIIDAMGKASAKAQKLHNAVTSDVKLKNSNHKVYLLKGKRENGSVVIGLIKVGYKRLFLMTLYGDQHECDPFCILDFYVHESEQRHGYGKKLFDFAIKAENKHPYQVAIDRPSEKFLNFLSKHFGLKNPVHQINKFVVYEKFFSDLDAIRAVERRRSAPIRRTLFLHDRPTSSNRNVSSASSIHSSRMNNSRQHQRKTFKDSPLLFNHSIQQLSRPNSKTNISSSTSVGVSSLLNPHKYIGGQSVNQTMTADTSLYRNYSRHSNRVSPQERKDSSNMTSSKTFNGKAMNNIVVMNGGCGNSVSGENILPPLDHPILQNQNASSIEETESKPKSINVGKELENKLNLDSEGNYIVDNLVRGIADSKQRLGTSWNVFGVPSNFSSVNSKQHNRHMKR